MTERDWVNPATQDPAEGDAVEDGRPTPGRPQPWSDEPPGHPEWREAEDANEPRDE